MLVFRVVLLISWFDYINAGRTSEMRVTWEVWGSSSKPHGSHQIDPPINLPQVQALETRIRNELITLGLFEPEEDTKVGGAMWSCDFVVGGAKIT